MSDTPRTDAEFEKWLESKKPYTDMCLFSRQLERELTDAHRTIESLRADNLAAKVAGQYAIDYIDGKHRDAGRVLDGWRKANR